MLFHDLQERNEKITVLLNGHCLNTKTQKLDFIYKSSVSRQNLNLTEAVLRWRLHVPLKKLAWKFAWEHSDSPHWMMCETFRGSVYCSIHQCYDFLICLFAYFATFNTTRNHSHNSSFHVLISRSSFTKAESMMIGECWLFWFRKFSPAFCLCKCQVVRLWPMQPKGNLWKEFCCLGLEVKLSLHLDFSS